MSSAVAAEPAGSLRSSGEGRHTPETAVVEERLQVRLLGSVEAARQPAHSPCAYRVSLRLRGCPNGYGGSV
jgi:hypothetical protein